MHNFVNMLAYKHIHRNKNVKVIMRKENLNRSKKKVLKLSFAEIIFCW